MRRRLGVLVLAVTAFVVLAYTIPLALLVARRAEDSAKVTAERSVQAVAAQLIEAVSLAQSGELVGLESLLTIPAGVSIVDEIGVTIGDPQATTTVSMAALARQQAVWGSRTDGGWELALPVVTLDGSLAVQTVVPRDDLRQGVGEAWTFLTVLGLGVILVALLLADRLGARLRQPVEDLAAAAHRLGAGELATRVEPQEIEELDVVADAFNRLAPRLEGLLVEERESLADLSHRLRTPLAALRLQSEALSQRQEREATASLVDRMESAIDELIETMRKGQPSGESDLAELVRRRSEFWAILAEEQERQFDRRVPSGPIFVPVSSDQLESIIDILIGNVIDHTDPGTSFAITVVETDGAARLSVQDDGPGFPSGIDVLSRGESGAGSTGLGLDIVKRIAQSVGGTISVAAGSSGGGRVEVELPIDKDPR